MMKHIKLFEYFFIPDINPDTIHAKMQELQDLIPANYEFNYELQIGGDLGQDQGFLYVHLFMLDQDIVINWTIDLDKLEIKFDDASQPYKETVSTIDEALSMIEDDIYDICGISEKLLLEKNVPKNPSLWQSCVAWAKSRYDVWPSAYACGAAAKRYKSKGGKWRKQKKRKRSRK